MINRLQMATNGPGKLTLRLTNGTDVTLRPGFVYEVGQDHRGSFVSVRLVGCVIKRRS